MHSVISKAGTDTLVRFGVSSTANIKIWLNDVLVYEQQAGMNAAPREVAYGKFPFNRYFTARQQKGSNKWLILLEAGNHISPVVFLRPQTAADDLDLSVGFNSAEGASWLYAGPFGAGGGTPLPASMQFPALPGANLYSWQKRRSGYYLP